MNTVLPVLSVMFAVLATAVPWGLPADATFVLPLIVLMMVFCWRIIPGATLSPVSAMMLGLLTDVISAGPLGFWAALALAAALAGGQAHYFSEGTRLRPLWVFWSAVAAGLALLGWLLASTYYMRWIDGWPILFGAMTSILLFPVVLRGLNWIRHGSIGRVPSMIYRGRT
jgi:rod shape-determining protein MreD